MCNASSQLGNQKQQPKKPAKSELLTPPPLNCDIANQFRRLTKSFGLFIFAQAAVRLLHADGTL
jgi:hypothetical protein